MVAKWGNPLSEAEKKKLMIYRLLHEDKVLILVKVVTTLQKGY